MKYGANWLLTGGVGALAGIAMDSVFSVIRNKAPELVEKIGEEKDTTSMQQAIKDELNDKALRDDIREFQEKFAELIEESKIDRLVIFIDELDRCRPDYAVNLLERIKHYFSNENAVISIIKDILSNYISYNLAGYRENKKDD